MATTADDASVVAGQDRARLRESIIASLESKFGDQLGPHDRERVAEEAIASFDRVPVDNFVPILARRRAHEEAGAALAAPPYL